MSARPDLAGVVVEHELLSGYTQTRHRRRFVGSFVCRCGHFEQEVENVAYQKLHAAHLAAALNAAIDAWLGDEGTREAVARAIDDVEVVRDYGDRHGHRGTCVEHAATAALAALTTPTTTEPEEGKR